MGVSFTWKRSKVITGQFDSEQVDRHTRESSIKTRHDHRDVSFIHDSLLLESAASFHRRQTIRWYQGSPERQLVINSQQTVNPGVPPSLARAFPQIKDVLKATGLHGTLYHLIVPPSSRFGTRGK
jgi:hypothetical protein